MKKITLMEALEGIEDTRRELSVRYDLTETLFIILVAIIGGATSYAKIEMFAKNRKEWLKKYIKLKNGIPDACTFRNIMKSIDSKKVHEVFIEWMKSVAVDLKGVVAIDGKQARGTKDDEKKPLHVVSAFSSEMKLVLGQIACEEKSNEITAIPKLLEMLEIEGCIVTIDAMGTQKDIAKKIKDKGADYILSVKENQKKLYEDIQLFFKDKECLKELKDDNKYAVTVNKGHGRIEKRECYIWEDISWLTGKEEWAGINGIGVIKCTIEEKEKVSKQNHYFIYSCKGMSALNILEFKRAHWSVENTLHWTLDMTFREDESRARKDNSAENLNALRHMVYNILKNDTTFKGSMSDKQYRCLLDEKYFENIINTFLFA